MVMLTRLADISRCVEARIPLCGVCVCVCILMLRRGRSFPTVKIHLLAYTPAWCGQCDAVKRVFLGNEARQDDMRPWFRYGLEHLLIPLRTKVTAHRAPHAMNGKHAEMILHPPDGSVNDISAVVYSLLLPPTGMH